MRQFETFEFDNMPIMSPVTIDTKHHGFWGAIWCWIITTRTWKIEEDWFYYLDGVQHVVKHGFVFDGASVPKYFRSWLSPMGILLIAGLVHDWGYKYAGLQVVGKQFKKDAHIEKNQKEMDTIFRDIAIEVNGFHFLNKVMYYVLRWFGFFAWNGHRKREKLEEIARQG